LIGYYCWRLVKFVPLLATVLAFAMYVVPIMGYGPIWNTYEEVIQPCNQYWWTVLIQINNFYPASSFDDKCLPWAWFIPALTQLSLLVPLFILCYKVIMPRMNMLRALFFIFIAIFALINGIIVQQADVGALPVEIVPGTDKVSQINYLTTVSFAFYEQVYMKPYFHLMSFFMGFGLAVIYQSFLVNSKKIRN